MSTSPTLLVANRGEIACRILGTARTEGYRTVAIYSEPDRQALHTRSADCAVAIGGHTPAESYLDIDKIIAAAQRSGATAVHPGYGFLAENAEFARACADNGLQFIGPNADVIELMGNKRNAKDFVARAGVPCIPGFQGSQDDVVLTSEAEKIGYPLMIKAAAGGGGRGMRLVHEAADIGAQLRSARSEALSAFGSDEIILEKALLDARHIEIQVFADDCGNVIHLGERDCSIQRRHQKIIEESPSPAVDADLRHRMGSAAVAAAQACGYLGAGTVEFLLDSDGEFYFLEMNTRLQVEHPVTEMVTGFDLVAWQLAVARGEPLPVSQEQVSHNGHAIEVRLYAEDPQNQFLPQTGRIHHWQEPAGEGIRIDHALSAGAEVSPYYDPMLGKLIAWGQDREEARRRLHHAIGKLQLIGPKNNLHFLRTLLEQPAFIAGSADTSFLEKSFSYSPPPEPAAATLAVATALLHAQYLSALDLRSGRANWRSGDNSLPLHYRLRCETREFDCQLFCLGEQRYRIAVDNGHSAIEILRLDDDAARLLIDGMESTQTFMRVGPDLYLLSDARQWRFADITYAPARALQGQGSGRITAPMDGCIVAIHVQAEQTVRRGDTIAVMEAMKMEHPLKADRDGTIVKLAATTGDQVRGGQLLVQIEPAEIATGATS
ncbi:acetyl/propionyl/methylcrotonyl-CoA carboxylase subunit alpha [Microbulbifer marinus]|uniref:Biotin carboxylase n=1 Tax=Microbulbifer marinus TaxID=658218 RepID=A0A1H3WAX5_9GAMM|nr:acetyl-CoA carboxylase biotin carboxylase subunit [Microbulbifer marinus]SDZ84237.1 geranyl-CoA carboxylase alpha subunit [Microbulbifer marinus]